MCASRNEVLQLCLTTWPGVLTSCGRQSHHAWRLSGTTSTRRTQQYISLTTQSVSDCAIGHCVMCSHLCRITKTGCNLAFDYEGLCRCKQIHHVIVHKGDVQCYNQTSQQRCEPRHVDVQVQCSAAGIVRHSINYDVRRRPHSVVNVLDTGNENMFVHSRRSGWCSLPMGRVT